MVWGYCTANRGGGGVSGGGGWEAVECAQLPYTARPVHRSTGQFRHWGLTHAEVLVQECAAQQPEYQRQETTAHRTLTHARACTETRAEICTKTGCTKSIRSNAVHMNMLRRLSVLGSSKASLERKQKEVYISKRMKIKSNQMAWHAISSARYCPSKSYWRAAAVEREG